MRRRRWLGALLATGIALTGCGNSDSDTAGNTDAESWAGTVVGTEDEVELGQWKGPATALTIDCSGDPDSSVTVKIRAPGEFVATSAQPEGGGPSSLTITGPDLEVTWDENAVASTVPDQEPDPEDAVQWGTSPTLTSGESSLDEYPLETDRDYYRFDLGDATVDCSRAAE